MHISHDICPLKDLQNTNWKFIKKHVNRNGPLFESEKLALLEYCMYQNKYTKKLNQKLGQTPEKRKRKLKVSENDFRA